MVIRKSDRSTEKSTPSKCFFEVSNKNNQYVNRVFLLYHIRVQSESILYNCLNVKKLFARNRPRI